MIVGVYFDRVDETLSSRVLKSDCAETCIPYPVVPVTSFQSNEGRRVVKAAFSTGANNTGGSRAVRKVRVVDHRLY